MALVVLLAWTVAVAGFLAVLVGYLFRWPIVPAQPGTPKADPKVSKQSYTPSAVPTNLDAVVIGSGIAGLTCAAVLARLGRRVLVVEQHDVAGGCCHSFLEGGYEFDTGVHYLGDVHRERTLVRALIDFVCDSKLEWAKLDEIDEATIAGDSYIYREGTRRYAEGLVEKFPEEAGAIWQYINAIKECERASGPYWLCKMLPNPLRAWVTAKVKRGFIPKYFDVSAYDFISQFTKNEKLIGVLTYLYGDLGLPPRRIPFALHAFCVCHYLNGAAYPVGGTGEIARTIIPVIERSGGKVLVRCHVDEILLEGNTAVGIRLQNGDEIRAPAIISDAGAYNTFEKLLSKEKAQEFGYPEKMKHVTHGVGHLYVFIGLRGDQEELKLPRRNLWVHPSYDHDATRNAFYADMEKMLETPFMFISFPSAKDPTFNKRFPGKSSCVIITEANYDWFQKFEKGPVKNRGEEYKRLKEKLAAPLVEAMYRFYPQTNGRVEVFEVGSPLTNNFYFNAPHGESYGLETSTERFNQDWLRVEQPIKNLYMTGQDVFSPGWGACLLSGLTTALHLASWFEKIVLLLNIPGWSRIRWALLDGRKRRPAPS